MAEFQVSHHRSHCFICQKCIQKLEQISQFICSSKKNNTRLLEALTGKEVLKIHNEDEKIIVMVEKQPLDEETMKVQFGKTTSLEIGMKTYVKEDIIEDILHSEKAFEDNDCKEEIDIIVPKDHSSVSTIEVKRLETFVSQENYEEKVTAHHRRPKEFKCEVCRRALATLQTKNTHVASHFGKLPVLCRACGKFFVGKREYIQHYRVHTLKAPKIKCAVCTQSLFKWQLDEHSKLHSNHQNLGGKVNKVPEGFSESLSRDERPHPCDMCQKTFTQKHHLDNHRKLHFGAKPFHCDICSRKFGQLAQLKAHKSLHAEQQLECGVCRRTFQCARNLAKHEARHERTSTECKVCGKVFSQHQNLAWHMKSHDKERHRCHVCAMTFCSNYSLERHVRTHTGERPFKCDVCSKGFTQGSNLREHMKRHNVEKSCHLCPEVFPSEEKLRVHLREHSGRESLSCDTCLRVFSRKRHLIEHQRKHTGEKPFKCNECPMAFTQQRYLTGHLVKHQSNQPQCKVCFRYFTLEERLVVHMRSHTGEKPQCELCHKTFVRRGELNVHMKKHNQEKSFKCDVCENKAFVRKCDLARHLMMHTGDRPFECEICSRGFRTKNNLKTHVIKVHEKAAK